MGFQLLGFYYIGFTASMVLELRAYIGLNILGFASGGLGPIWGKPSILSPAAEQISPRLRDVLLIGV